MLRTKSVILSTFVPSSRFFKVVLLYVSTTVWYKILGLNEYGRGEMPEERKYPFAWERTLDDLRGVILATRRTYSELAQVTGLSPGTVQKFCCGETRNPTSRTLFCLLDAAGYRMTATGIEPGLQPPEPIDLRTHKRRREII
jgi:transcriptional regulator with XRE-family HTH domain